MKHSAPICLLAGKLRHAVADLIGQEEGAVALPDDIKSMELSRQNKAPRNFFFFIFVLGIFFLNIFLYCFFFFKAAFFFRSGEGLEEKFRDVNESVRPKRNMNNGVHTIISVVSTGR